MKLLLDLEREDGFLSTKKGIRRKQEKFAYFFMSGNYIAFALRCYGSCYLAAAQTEPNTNNNILSHYCDLTLLR